MARRGSKRYDQGKGVRRIARERVGQVAPSRVLDDKAKRKKPKHKKSIDPESPDA